METARFIIAAVEKNPRLRSSPALSLIRQGGGALGADFLRQVQQLLEQRRPLRAVEIPPDRPPLAVGFGQQSLGALGLEQAQNIIPRLEGNQGLALAQLRHPMGPLPQAGIDILQIVIAQAVDQPADVPGQGLVFHRQRDAAILDGNRLAGPEENPPRRRFPGRQQQPSQQNRPGKR